MVEQRIRNARVVGSSPISGIIHSVNPNVQRVPLWRFLAPRFWPIWVGVGLVRLLILLPFRLLTPIGRTFGRIAWCSAARERHVAAVNIRLCLSDLEPREVKRLIRRHFEMLGCALFDTALVWWASDQRLQPRVRLEGTEHLAQALARGHGAILLSAHFTSLEMGARALAMHGAIAITYQTPRNPLIAELSLRARAGRAQRAISSGSVRDLLQSLKDNLPLWYAPDQTAFGKASAVVPFFGQAAATNVATSRIARITGATVLPYFPERLADGSGFLMRILPPFEDFPSDDPIADAARFHALIEAHVRRCPEQYVWTYKRFKRPGPDGDPYRR